MANPEPGLTLVDEFDNLSELLKNLTLNPRQDMKNKALRLASFRNLPQNFHVMATDLARNGHYIPNGGINDLSVQTVCYSCGHQVNWNPDTTADGRALHRDDCELSPVNISENGAKIVSPTADGKNHAVFTSENGAKIVSPTADGGNHAVVTSENGAKIVSPTADGENHAVVTSENGAKIVSPTADGGNHAVVTSVSNFYKPIPFTVRIKHFLRSLEFKGYCSLATIFGGLYLSGNDKAREEFQKLLCKSDFEAYNVLNQVLEIIKNNSIEEAVKFWIFEMYKPKEIFCKWVKWENDKLVLNLTGNENETVINKLKIVPEKRQPLLLFLTFTDWLYLVVKKNHLPETLKLNGASYKLVFYTNWKDRHFTAIISKNIHDTKEWSIYDVNEFIGPASKDEYQSADTILKEQMKMSSETISDNMSKYLFTVHVDRSTSENQLKPNCFSVKVPISDGENQFEASIQVQLNYVDQSSVLQPNVGIDFSSKTNESSIPMQVTGDQLKANIPVQVNCDQSDASVPVLVTGDEAEASIPVKIIWPDGRDPKDANIKVWPVDLISTAVYQKLKSTDQ